MMGGGDGSLCSNQEPLASEYLVPLGRVPTPIPHRCCPCQGPSLTRGLMSQGGGRLGPGGSALPLSLTCTSPSGQRPCGLAEPSGTAV